MNNYQYPTMMELSRIRRLKIKNNSHWVSQFRKHWVSKVFYVVAGISVFWLVVWTFSLIDQLLSGTNGFERLQRWGFLYLLSWGALILAIIGFGIVRLVHGFIVEIEVLIRQYQQRKQESFLDKQAAYSYSLEDYLHMGDEYLKLSNFRKAHAAYSLAISINPKHWRGYLSRIDCFWLSQGYAIDPRHLAYFSSFPNTKLGETNRDGVHKLIDFAQKVVAREEIFINENGRVILDQSDELQSHYLTLHAPLPPDLGQLISDCIQVKRNWPDNPSERTDYLDFLDTIQSYTRGLDLIWERACPPLRGFSWWQHKDLYNFFGKELPREPDKDENYYRQHLFLEALSEFRYFVREFLWPDWEVAKGLRIGGLSDRT